MGSASRLSALPEYIHVFRVADENQSTTRELNGLRTPTYEKTELGCPPRSQISDAFSSVEAMVSNKWSEIVRALSACTQKPRIHTKATEGKEYLCLYCYNDDKLSLADRFHSFFVSFVAPCASGRFFGR